MTWSSSSSRGRRRQRAAPLESLPLDDLRRQFEVNVIGQVATTQAMLPLVRKAAGRIVFVGSVGGVLASQFAGA